MRTAPLIAAAFMALAATSSWAQTDTSKPQTGASVPPVKVTAARDPDEIVCVRREEEGSRIPGAKECHTRRIWDQMSEDARQQTQDIQQRNQTMTTMKGG